MLESWVGGRDVLEVTDAIEELADATRCHAMRYDAPEALARVLRLLFTGSQPGDRCFERDQVGCDWEGPI